MSDTISKSWFLTFANPEEHGYTGTPEEILYKMRDEYIQDSETRSGAWAYCISADGFKHVHMVLEDCKAMRFTYIKNNFYKGANIQETKGSRKQALDYIHKRGAFAEKGETVEAIVFHGDINGRQGQRRDLADIYKRLEAGETPQDIITDSPKEYIHLDVIKRMYYDIRSSNTPIVRPIKVIWHTGKSGSGKSYSRIDLARLHGEEQIYYLTAFNSGAFDRYNGEPILWIEDFRGEFKLQELLRMLDVYKAEVPSRYSNAKALWDEVHITSVLTPQQVYSAACKDEFDRIEQLLRRITSIRYHFKTNNGLFKSIDFAPDTLLDTMIKEAQKVSYVSDNYLPFEQFGSIDDYEEILGLEDCVGGSAPVGLPPTQQEEKDNETK